MNIIKEWESIKESRRYIDTPPEFYCPDKWRKRAENKKQGSSDEVFETEPIVAIRGWEQKVRKQ